MGSQNSSTSNPVRVAITKLYQVGSRHKVFGFFFAALLILRYLLAPYGNVVTCTDTGGYVERARAPLWNFFHGYDQGKPFARPWGYALLLKQCRFNPDQLDATGSRLLRAQSLISVLALGCSGLLGCFLFKRLSIRILWMIFFFAISLSAFIYPWEPMAMTEGVACNGLVFLLAMMFILATPAWGMREAFLTAILTTLFMFLKDANSFTGLVVLGLVLLDQLLVRNRPGVALARLMDCLLRSPRQFVRSPVFVLACLLLAATGLKFRDLGQHAVVRDMNLRSFFVHRILNYPPLRQAYLKQIGLPPEYRNPIKTQEDGEALFKQAGYDQQQHLNFLLSNPGPAFKAFNMYSGDIVAWAALKTDEEIPKPYTYLYNWGIGHWDSSQPNNKMLFSYRFHRAVVWPFSGLVYNFGPWPFFVPLVLLLAAFFLRLKIGSSTLFLPLALLASTFYIHHGLSILFEGIEDYRHALIGTFALIVMPWLVAWGFTQAVGERYSGWLSSVRRWSSPGNMSAATMPPKGSGKSSRRKPQRTR